MWVNCGLDLMQLKESIENLDIFLSEMAPDPPSNTTIIVSIVGVVGLQAMITASM